METILAFYGSLLQGTLIIVALAVLAVIGELMRRGE